MALIVVAAAAAAAVQVHGALGLSCWDVLGAK